MPSAVLKRPVESILRYSKRDTCSVGVFSIDTLSVLHYQMVNGFKGFSQVQEEDPTTTLHISLPNDVFEEAGEVDGSKVSLPVAQLSL